MGKFIDLTGQKFGELEIIEYNKETAKWLCLCSCGAYKEVRGCDLTHGKTKSCGNRKKHAYSPPNFTNLVNKKFGDRLVLKYDGYDSDTEKSYWICRCSCGKIERITTQALKNSGKCNHNNVKYIDIQGQRFGKLTVLKRLDDGKWLCRCDCGNIKAVLASNLRSGGTSSCGCNIQTKLSKEQCIEYIKQFIEKYNCKPSRLELEEIFGVSKTIVAKYIDRYELDDYVETKYRSRQERYIAKKLIDNGVKIETNCRNLIDGHEIDIYIPSIRLAIEFNGNYWHSELHKDKYYHQNKSLECIRNDIDLLHIFEYDFDKIDDIIDNILRCISGNKFFIENEKSFYRIVASKEIECPLYNSLIKKLVDIGYEVSEIIEPSFVWLDSKSNKIDTTDNNSLDDISMYNNGCYKIYDAGSIRLKLKQ